MKKFFVITFFIMLLFVVGCTGYVTVTFDTQGGNEISSVTVLKGKTVSEPEEPVRGDDDFLGWYLNGTQWDFNNPVNENITLVAKYLEQGEFKVVFYDYDGNVLKIESVKEGESATAPEAPEIEGYTFVGWDKDYTSEIGRAHV